MFKFSIDSTVTTDQILAMLAIIVGGFIAYHLYFLQKRISFNSRMGRKDKIRNEINDHLSVNRRDGANDVVNLVNTRRYLKGYEAENRLSLRKGYVELGVALKAANYDGIEVFDGMWRQTYKDKKGRLTLKKTHTEAYLVRPVGVIPYDWIEYIDWRGDEFYNRPLIFIKYRGLLREPYKETRLYMKPLDADRDDSRWLQLVKVRQHSKLWRFANLIRLRFQR